MKTKDFLWEIGLEEIPSSLVLPVAEQLKQLFIEQLKEFRVGKKEIYNFSTPFRIGLFGKLDIKNIPEAKKIQGPRLDLAFDKGNPTQTYFGFLKAHNAEEQDLMVEDTDKGKYLFLVKKSKPKQTHEILKEILPKVILKITLPKYMRWDNSGLKFIRPIRWLLVVFGHKFLKIKVGNLVSCDFTVIRIGANYHRIKIKSINDYFKKLKQAKVIISYTERRSKIEQALKRKANDLNAIHYLNPELISEVTNLVESPYILAGEFKKEFLKLPQVVLLASMSKYQRVFALKDKKDKFLNKFLAVTESKPGNLKQAKKNYEFVLNARLSDASYFYTEDIKENLEKKVENLKDVLLHHKLGSIYDKIQALKLAGMRIADIIALNEQEKKDLLRAIELFKADLVTKMVSEFPSLEAVMGSLYAKYFGENERVSIAISEHYKPRTNEDTLPNTKLGALLSLLDKVYNVIGILGVGEIPSASEDPFAIRRQIQGLTRLLIQYQFEISLDELFSLFLELLKDKLTKEPIELRQIFFSICKERFQAMMREENIPGDLISAVSDVNFIFPSEVYLRIKKLLTIYDKKEFYYACKVVERTANIIKDEKEFKDISIDEMLFKEHEEKKLWQVYLDNRDRIISLIEKRDYDIATKLYGKVFYDIIHLFFDKVLVNVEDSKLRKNRKILLFLINSLLTQKVAELKEMEVLKDAK